MVMLPDDVGLFFRGSAPLCFVSVDGRNRETVHMISMDRGYKGGLR